MLPHELFQQEKRNVTERVLSLCEETAVQLQDALDAVRRSDMELAGRIRLRAVDLRRVELEIDELCTHMIALKAPVAGDLRTIIAFIKIGNDFERIASHAVKLGAEAGSGPFISQFLDKIAVMVETGTRMLRLIEESLRDTNSLALQEIAVLDDKIDSTYKELSAELNKGLSLDQTHLEEGVRVLMLLRYLERVGDHVTNIAEWVHFAQTGTHIELNA